MSSAYRRGVQESFGNVQIVFVKFHVVSQVAKAVDEVKRGRTSRPGSNWNAEVDYGEKP